jgi:hypothetical protein
MIMNRSALIEPVIALEFRLLPGTGWFDLASLGSKLSLIMFESYEI